MIKINNTTFFGHERMLAVQSTHPVQKKKKPLGVSLVNFYLQFFCYKITLESIPKLFKKKGKREDQQDK